VARIQRPSYVTSTAVMGLPKPGMEVLACSSTNSRLQCTSLWQQCTPVLKVEMLPCRASEALPLHGMHMLLELAHAYPHSSNSVTCTAPFAPMWCCCTVLTCRPCCPMLLLAAAHPRTRHSNCFQTKALAPQEHRNTTNLCQCLVAVQSDLAVPAAHHHMPISTGGHAAEVGASSKVLAACPLHNG
jgi:hypothetical protein